MKEFYLKVVPDVILILLVLLLSRVLVIQLNLLNDFVRWVLTGWCEEASFGVAY